MIVFQIQRTDTDADPVRLATDAFWLGRHAMSDVVLSHPSVALAHAGFHALALGYCVAPLGDEPVWLNGVRLPAAAWLQLDDVIQLGLYCLSVVAVESTELHLRLERVMATPDDLPAAQTGLSARAQLDELQQTEISAHWHAVLPAGVQADETARVTTFSSLPSPTEQSEPIEAEPRSRQWRKTALRVAALVGAVALLTALVYPRAYAPGSLAQVHGRIGLKDLPHARQSADGSCFSCHTPTRPLALNCANCHTTQQFTAGVSQAHTQAQLSCQNCHQEHQGPQANLLAVKNATCTQCHQAGSTVLGRTGKALTQPHGGAVDYPVNALGLWDWDGLSSAEWQQRQLTGLPADYNLREQFHLLHGNGRTQGRSACADCHLGAPPAAFVEGIAAKEVPALRAHVRESCAQCHRVSNGLARQLEQTAPPGLPNKPGAVTCVECHAQHGAEKEARASVR